MPGATCAFSVPRRQPGGEDVNGLVVVGSAAGEAAVDLFDVAAGEIPADRDLDLAGHLNPGTAHGVEKVGDLCFNEQDVIAALLRGSQIPEQVFPDATLNGDLGETLRANSPTGPWPAPVLIAQGLADPLVKPAMQQKWVDTRCRAGEPLDYRTYPGLDHTGLVAADSPLTPQLVQWTLDRWNGAKPTPTC